MDERDPVIRIAADCPICGEERTAAYTASMVQRDAEPDELFVAVRQVEPDPNHRGPVAPLHLVHATHLN